MEIRSGVGEGTSVILHLPRAQAVAVETKATARPADGAYPGVDLHQSVLVVEDNEDVATLAAEMLSGLGYEVTRVASAPAALARLENGHAGDLVFSDVTLPGGMNGFDLARELKRRHPNLPIVLTTGYSDALRSNASTEGLQMLPKPYRFEGLQTAIRAALAPSSQPTSPA